MKGVTKSGSESRHQKAAVPERSHRSGDGCAESGPAVGPRPSAAAVRHPAVAAWIPAVAGRIPAVAARISAAPDRVRAATARVPAILPLRRRAHRLPAQSLFWSSVRAPDWAIRPARLAERISIADGGRSRAAARWIWLVPTTSRPGHAWHPGDAGDRAGRLGWNPSVAAVSRRRPLSQPD